tara:strand:+ start:322 stop:480 length:159 start_codon:yes stop_codon:yes gene_type:complete
MSNINFINLKSTLSILFSIIRYKKISGKKNNVGSQIKTEKKENKIKSMFLNQ